MSKKHQRASTRLSQDGRSVFVRLNVSRLDFEFARAWAAFHAQADPAGTAEDHLEGMLASAVLDHRLECGWCPPPEIANQIAADSGGFKRVTETEDELPF